jgi:hypothetical protein
MRDSWKAIKEKIVQNDIELDNIKDGEASNDLMKKYERIMKYDPYDSKG